MTDAPEQPKEAGGNPGNLPVEITGDHLVHFIRGLPIAQDIMDEQGQLRIMWGGELNRRLAFELAEGLGREGAKNLLRFAQLVAKYAE